MFTGKVALLMAGDTGSIISACCHLQGNRSVIQITD